MSNPFAEADAFEPYLDQLLPVGNHVVKITEAQGGFSPNNKWRIELRLENADGSIRHYQPVTEGTIPQIVALCQATGVARPGDGDFDPSTLRPTDQWIARLVGRSCGIVIREEPGYDAATGREDPSKPRLRVQGYVTPQRIAQSVSNGGQFSSPRPAPAADVPF